MCIRDSCCIERDLASIRWGPGPFVDGRGCSGEASPAHPTRPVAEGSVRWLQVPARGHSDSRAWYLRYGLSYRDLEELLAERGIEVDHVTLFRWVQRFTPILVEAAKPCRHSVGGHWFVDETYVKVSGSWRYVYRPVDQYGQVIDVLLSKKRDLRAATAFFATAIRSHGAPAEVTTDRAHALVRVVADLLPAALHDTTQYANNRVEADHGRLKARLRPMRGLKLDRTARVVIRGHAFIQNLRRGHYELGVDVRPGLTLTAAFDELAQVIGAAYLNGAGEHVHVIHQRNSAGQSNFRRVTSNRTDQAVTEDPDNPQCHRMPRLRSSHRVVTAALLQRCQFGIATEQAARDCPQWARSSWCPSEPRQGVER